MDVLVVGAGTMGRWLGDVLNETAEPTALTVADTDLATARRVAEQLDCRVCANDDTEAFDLVCFAVPMPALEDAVVSHAARTSKAVLDVTGRMREPLSVLAEHAPSCARASLHPLFAPENEPGSVPVVVAEDGPEIELVREALSARGNHVFETTAAEHDEAMETVQATAHAAVLAFGLAADEVDPAFHTPVSETLVELLARVTDGSPGVYADIQTAFAGATELAEAADRVADADREQFEQLYESFDQ